MRMLRTAALGTLVATITTLAPPAVAATGLQHELDQMVADGTPGW